VYAAESLLGTEPPLQYPACFHSQQAAEKYLKAFLVHNQADFPKTHDIQKILNLVDPVDPQLAHSLEDVIGLTEYAVEERYPSDLPEPDMGEAKAALVLASKVRDAVFRALSLN
jgi:HEPN domain-containing protein